MGSNPVVSEPSLPNRPRGETLRVFAFFVCAFALSNNGFDTSEAGNHYDVARNIVTTGRLGFDEPKDGVFTTAPNGRTYASHEFGNTLLLIPTAAINHGLASVSHRFGLPADRILRLQQFLLSFQAGIYAAATLTLLYLILTRIYKQPTRTGFLCCLAVGFCTFFWSYSRNLFDGVLCGLLLIAALYALLRYRESGSRFLVWVAFSLLGLAVDTRISMVLPTIFALGFILAIRRFDRREALAIGVVALLPFATWQMWYNHLRTGHAMISPVQTAQYADNNALDGDLMTGLVGLLVSPGKGLFIYAPFLAVSIVAFPRFWRRDRATACLVLVTGLAWLVLHAKLRSWYGAWGWGPRHMMTLLPLMLLPGLVHMSELAANKWGRGLLGVSLIIGFILAFASIFGNWHYRMGIAAQEGRLVDAEFVWGWQSQAIDMVTGVGRNAGVLVGVRPPDDLQGVSEINNFASNRLNVWWLTLPRSGIPSPIVAVTCLVLLAGAAFSANGLLARRQPDESRSA